MNTYSPLEQRVVDQLRLFLGEEAPAVYERCGRSLLRLADFARDSANPGCRLLAAGLQLAQELLAEPMRRAPVLDSPTAVCDYLKLHFAGQVHESFVVMYLNAQNHLVAVEELFRGTLTQTSVYPREVLRRALSHGAGGLVIAHCHPSGVAEPSPADQVLTIALKQVLEAIDVRVVDHIVIAGTQAMSFAQRGLI
jgi:DNA repair protein RadC